MSQSSDDPSFLARWSRHKRLAQAQSAVRPAGSATADMAPPADAGAPEAEVDLTALPKLEDLTADSDISAFLQRGVPDALKQLVMRRMWSLDPQIRDFVEVAENQWDFNAAGGVYGLFEDLPAGSDMTTWVAQATQSTWGGAPFAPVVDGAEVNSAPARPHEGSKTDGMETAEAPPATRADAHAQTKALRDSDPSEVSAPKLAITVADGDRSQGSVSGRPRHGGALPR